MNRRGYPKPPDLKLEPRIVPGTERAISATEMRRTLARQRKPVTPNAKDSARPVRWLKAGGINKTGTRSRHGKRVNDAA